MPSLHYNALIDSNATRVWRVLKPFAGISQWHPSVLQSVIEDGLPDGQVGCIRRLGLKDGAILRERLLALDDSQLSFSYRFEQAPLPIDDYVMTVKLIPISEKEMTLIQWSARFDNREPDPQGLQREVISELIVEGHHSLQAYLAS